MSQTFNLSKFNNTREAINVYYPTSKPVSEEYTPLPVIPFPDLVKEVLGVDVDQIDSNIVRELADHYVRSLPSPEAIGPAFESVKSILVDPNPTRKMEQLSAAIELLKKDKNLADLFQIVKSEIGDKGLEILKQKAFAQFGFDYKPEYVEIFKQRVNPKTIESLAKIYQEKTSAGDDASEIKMVAAQLRQDYTSAASEMYNDFVDKCRGLGLNDQQIYWVMTHGKSADPQKLPLSDPPISPDVVKELLNDNNTIVTRISQFFSENAASLFSENVEAMKKQGMSQDSIDTMLRIAKEVGGSIGRDEYLASVNLSRIEVPDDPRDLLDDTIDPDSDLPREVQMRLNPQNLNIVKALLEKGGYVINGKTYKKLPRLIGELKSSFGFEGDEAWQQVQSLYGEGKTLSDDSAAFPTGNYVDFLGLFMKIAKMAKKK
jgi:DNA-binding transcriptional regulator YhcF (GntR family)